MTLMAYTGKTPKLAACPFCGDGPRMYRDGGSWGYYPPSAQVRCECGASGSHIYQRERYYRGTAKTSDEVREAAAAWNQRTT